MARRLGRFGTFGIAVLWAARKAARIDAHAAHSGGYKNRLVRFAVIHNPRSRLNLRDRDGFEAQASRRLGSAFVRTTDLDTLRSALEELARRSVDTIAINGGDGTVSHVLTAIAKVYPADHLPRIAILPSGNTNLIAADVGFGLRGTTALDALDATPRRIVHALRAPIRVRWPGTDRAPVMGMFQGSAAYARAIAIAHSPGVLKYAPHDLAVGVTLASAIGGLVLNPRTRRTWLDGEALHLRDGDEDAQADKSFLFLATALQKLTYGVWPFWRGPGTTADGVHYLNVHANPRRLPGALANLLRGRAPAWLRTSDDYESGCSQALRIASPGDFVLDGEMFDTGPHGEITLESGPRFSFLRSVTA